MRRLFNTVLPARVAVAGGFILLGVIAACATTAPVVDNLDTYKGVAGTDTRVTLADAQYLVPPLLEIAKPKAETPGITHFVFKDFAVGCQGEGLFQMNGDAAAHEQYMADSFKEHEDGWRGRAWDYARKASTTPILEQDARLTTYELTFKGEKIGPFAFIDRHYSESALSIVFWIDCSDDVLMQKQVERLVKFCSTREPF